MGQFTGLPNSQQTRPSIVRSTKFTGETETWIVTTFRQTDEDGAATTVFLEHVDAEGSERFVLPPKVIATINKQQEALIAKTRKHAAQAAAKTRKAKGITPFVRKAGA